MQKPGLFGMNGLSVFLLISFSFAARAQQPGYLILIDAESKQAFTVRMGDQFYTSSGHGHLVLSNLKDSGYRLNLSFVKMHQAEQVFPVVIHHKDLGFLLKGSDSALVLYNWQTKETIRAVKEKDSSRILDMGIKREDGFSKLMASVVNDSTVMYNTYTGNGFARDSTVSHILPTANGQPSAVNRLPSTVYRQPPTANRQLSTALPPGIKKLREVSLKISRKIVFLDVSKEGLADTITLYVFFENRDSAVNKQALAVVSPGKKPPKTDSAGEAMVTPRSKPVLKSSEPGCGQLATDADVEFLRSAILKSNTEQDKIALASSAFELKCFSVSQIRLLAGLFVSDKSKYKLMEAAHLHIADREHFHELVDMLTDRNFQRKFRVMADKRS